MAFSRNNESNKKISGEVLDRISYEVKESLTSIIGFSNIIKKSCIDSCKNPKQEERLDKILFSSEKLLEFANNISDFSKLITEKYEANSYTFSTGKLLNELLLSFKAITKNKKIRFKLNISEIKIKNDYQLTSQIIYGLFSYLIKLSPEGSLIIVKNAVAKDGILIEIETAIIKSINKEKNQDLNNLLTEVDDYYGNLDFYLINHLITLIEGQIILSDPKENSSKIQIYIPNKSD